MSNTIKVFTYVYVVGMLSMAWLTIQWPVVHFINWYKGRIQTH